jgi:hypothetical protein
MHREVRLEHFCADHLRQSVHRFPSTILFSLEDEMRNRPVFGGQLVNGF